MNWRTTVILALLAVGVGVYIKFWESKTPTTKEANRQAQNIVNIEKDKIDGIVIQNGDEKIDLRKAGDKWRLESPIKDQADASLISNLLFDIDGWQKEGTITPKEIEADKNKLGEFGLNKPKLRLKLSGPNAPPEIWFGKDAALEGKLYVRFENSKETYLANQSVRKAIEKKPDEFRDKKLTDVAAAQVSRLVLKVPAGEMELQRNDEHWEIVKPLRARADDQKVGDLIAQVTTAHIQQFVTDDRGDLNPYGLAQPRGSITLFTEDKAGGKSEPAGQTLQIGAVPEKEKDQVYARFSARGFVYTLPKTAEQLLNTKPNDLRDRHLVRFDDKMLDRITIEAPGRNKTVLARKGEEWSIANRNNIAANSSGSQRLLEILRNEQVIRFVEDVASNLPKYGLDKPALTITLSSFASENTAETKAGERPLTSIALGRAENNEVYARVADEPFIVSVRKPLLDLIAADPLAWQDVAIFKFKPEQIHRASVTSDKELVLVRGPKNDWTWAKGEGTINQANVSALVNALANLRAMRWAGPTTPAHGFEKPQLVINFTTSPDDKAIHKLTVGAGTGDGTFYARVDEREGTFIISGPDLTAFKSPMVQSSPPPSPAPALSPSPGVSLVPHPSVPARP